MPSTDGLRINAIAAAAGIDRRTVVRRLNEAGVHPDAGGKFDPRDALKAICGGIQAAKLRHAEATAALAEIELARTRNELLPAERVGALWHEALVGLRTVIVHSTLTKVEQGSLLKQLREIPIAEYAETPAAETTEDAP